jgi:hypothetical protein
VSDPPNNADHGGLQGNHMSVEQEARAWKEVLAISTSQQRTFDLFLPLDPAPETRDTSSTLGTCVAR